MPQLEKLQVDRVAADVYERSLATRATHHLWPIVNDSARRVESQTHNNVDIALTRHAIHLFAWSRTDWTGVP